MKAAIFLLLLSFLPWVQAAPLPVVVSVLPQKTIVEAIGGDAVEVRVLVGKGYNPATYQPTPRQIAGFSRARLFVRAGMPFEESWLPRLSSVNPDLKIIDMRSGLPLLSHHHGGQDPHVWTDPLRVVTHAKRLTQTLTELLPEQQTEIDRNLADFLLELDKLDAYIHARLDKLEQRRFLVFHPAWSYFAQRYGLQQLAIEQDGKEPGARRLAQLIDQARADGIDVIITQPQHNSASAQVIADAIGARLVSINPLAEDYFGSLRRLADVLSHSQ